ncbi:helix-turn-helix domain-containing protein [Roseivirga seohaensis]|nr:helix-turn-helix domain-containing protein [Roseivirga seohaensis]
MKIKSVRIGFQHNTNGGTMEVIVIESKAFEELLNQLVEKLQPTEKELNKWIDGKEAMEILHITAKSTLQKMRDNGEIEFSKINDRTILYNRFSIEEFIESKKSKTF